MRLIPGKTKVQIEIFKNISIADMMVGCVLTAILIFIATGNLPYKWVFAAIHAVISAVLLYKLDSESNYLYILKILRHYGFGRKFDKADTDDFLVRLASEKKEDVLFDELFPENDDADEEAEKGRSKKSKKNATKKASKENSAKKNSEKSKGNWADVEELTAYSEISDGFIKYKSGYYGAAFRIPDVEFRFFSQMRRDNSIENGLGAVIRMFKSDLCTNIVKIERPIEYGSYVDDIYEKINELKRAFEHGFINEDEMKARLTVLYSRLEQLNSIQGEHRIVIPFYYIVVYDKDVNRLKSQLPFISDTLTRAEMKPQRLDDKELALLLKYSNDIDFDEKLIDKIKPEDYARWAMPDNVEFTPRKTIVNGIITHNFRVTSYPVVVSDAWLASILTLPSTKVVIKMKAMDNSDAIKSLDRSISELRGVVANARTDSQAIDAQTHLETLQEMLITLKNNNESLYEVNIYITAYDVTATANDPSLLRFKGNSLRSPMNNMKRMVKSMWNEQGFKLNNMEFMQATSYIGGQITAYDPLEKKGRGIPSNSIAACFPWVFPIVMDDKGMFLGTSDGVPIFLDFFKRDSERVNSNLVIIGKSGSGKSFSIKTVLANLAADDAKIFVLDPEDEYTDLAANLHGQFINVATNQNGILNPFHIIAGLDDEEGEATGTSYSNHLQFLEEFFKQILPDCDRDSLEYLNTLVDIIYKHKGIDARTDISKLRPEDYPIFDDLYDEILLEFQRTNNEYLRTMLRSLMNYISKFAEGGRNSTLWNGPSSVTTDQNFTVFNFQSLLANRNNLIANAQLLLILKYLDNEIIKNRDYNEKYGLNRKIVVVIDEAHVFIDTKYPIALDFMFQLAKRIRKYNGMQIVITQNIKDFVGSEEIARKSTAIINACQYSFIFALAPNDMEDLCKLYEKAGGINEAEQEQITQAARGHAFTVLSPASRTSFSVTAHPQIQKMFEGRYNSPYFTGRGAEENWLTEMGDSIRKRAENQVAAEAIREEADQNASHASRLIYSEIDEKEYELENQKTHQEIVLETASLTPDALPEKQASILASGDNTLASELLSGVIDKLGEISSALSKTASARNTSSDSQAALTEEIKKLTEKIGTAGNITTSASAASDIKAPESDGLIKLEDFIGKTDSAAEDSENKLVLGGSLFDRVTNISEENTESTAEAPSEEDSYVPVAQEPAEDAAPKRFSVLDFIKNNIGKTTIAEASAEEETPVEAEPSDRIDDFLYGDDNSNEDTITVSLEDLVLFNSNITKRIEGK